MKIALIIGGIFLSLLIMLGIVAATSYVSANNYAVTVEAELKAARSNNKNILAQYEQKILEAAQVPEMYKNDLKEIVSAAMQGRYGADGSKATFQWIKENNLSFDSSMYNKIVDLIQAGRTDFSISQTRMLDIKRGYETQLGYVWRGFWLRVAGFPKINMGDYEPVITDRVEETFKNNKEKAPLKLR